MGWIGNPFDIIHSPGGTGFFTQTTHGAGLGLTPGHFCYDLESIRFKCIQLFVSEHSLIQLLQGIFILACETVEGGCGVFLCKKVFPVIRM